MLKHFTCPMWQERHVDFNNAGKQTKLKNVFIKSDKVLTESDNLECFRGSIH